MPCGVPIEAGLILLNALVDHVGSGQASFSGVVPIGLAALNGPGAA